MHKSNSACGLDNYDSPVDWPAYQDYDWRELYKGHPCYTPGEYCGTWEAPGRHRGGTGEAPGRHLGIVQIYPAATCQPSVSHLPATCQPPASHLPATCRPPLSVLSGTYLTSVHTSSHCSQRQGPGHPAVQAPPTLQGLASDGGSPVRAGHHVVLQG